ncbi:S-methyl-5-thioribose-1-phosphate isomerase [Hahella sp. SMD15-11]|uniref:Methylthioribose-1-phosphate isomerase n=1 Tax=Thermohahella caldifontis TaxID=3142973 RepID=A0AB39UW75_9GAMM
MQPIFQPLTWEAGHLRLIDQRALPREERWLTSIHWQDTAAAIRDMVVRGAPAIGIAAAWGIVQAAHEAAPVNRESLRPAFEGLAASRPTAVNLFWALERMEARLAGVEGQSDEAIRQVLEAEARAIHEEDLAANLRMGELGADWVRPLGRGAVLTHCNTGSLATGGYGTALGVIRSAWQAGLVEYVFVDETRPWLQGARLTAWELVRDGISARLIADVAAASVMRDQGVKWVVVGADRITARGDVANKIGTYGLAVLARYHGVKFLVAAPVSTIDPNLERGEDIPIEERDPAEVRQVGGVQLAPDNVDAFNPVFDVTPAELVDAIITEKGVVERPDREKIRTLLSSS